MAQSQYFPPTSFNSSSLVRLLASLDVAPATRSTQTFAERLAHWVAWTDAISLSGALGAGVDRVRAGSAVRVDAVVQDLQRLRLELTGAVTHDPILSGTRWSNTRAGTPGAAASAGDAPDYDFAAYRRSFAAQQRTMEERIRALRGVVRAVAADHSPAFCQLAALDAAMDTALAVHQRRVTANVPMLLEKRFKGTSRPLQGTATQQQGVPVMAPGKPPAAYGRTLQAVLLAEMEVRLQPVAGMIDALRADVQEEHE